MRLIYTKPKLKDLSIGSRIAFVRQFRLMTQNDVSDELGISGDCKRRTMARYENGNRNQKESRVLELAEILNVSINSIKLYDYKNPIDIIYTLMWLEELFPNYKIDLPETYDNLNINNLLTSKFMAEWTEMRIKRANRKITYEEYIEWKLNYEIEKERK